MLCPKVGSVDPVSMDLRTLALRKHGVPWSELKVPEQVNVIRQALAAQQLTFDPDSEGYLKWMVVMFVTYIFTALVTPYEVAFMNNMEQGALFVINRVIDIIFSMDIFINFFLRFKVPARNARRYVWVYDRRMIALKYLRCWFWVDILALSQFDIWIFLLGLNGLTEVDATQSVTSVPQVTEKFKIIRLIRLLRLVKVFRRLRKCRFVEICLSKGSALTPFGLTFSASPVSSSVAPIGWPVPGAALASG